MTSLAYAMSDADLRTLPRANPSKSAWETQSLEEPTEWKVVAQTRTRGAELIFMHEPPSWAALALGDLLELLELPEGWNSYNAQPVELDVVQQAGYLLFDIVDPLAPRPAIVPTARGGVQLEWHGDADVEVEIHPNGSVGFLSGDAELDFGSWPEAVPTIRKALRRVLW